MKVENIVPTPNEVERKKILEKTYSYLKHVLYDIRAETKAREEERKG